MKESIWGLDLNKPIGTLIEDIRNEMGKSRGKVQDLVRKYPQYKDHIEHVAGLLTCGIVSLYNSKEKIRDIQIANDDLACGQQHIFFRSRGIGVDKCNCFVCEKHGPRYNNNISGFVKTKEDGLKIVNMFDFGAHLDYREYEPDWIQVKIGACDKHLDNLKKLDELVSVHNVIRKNMIEKAKNLSVKRK